MKIRMSMMTMAALSCISVKAADLTIPAGTTRSVDSNEEYGTVSIAGGTVLLNAQLKSQSINATADSTIKFNGGRLAASSWDKTWFQPSAGAVLALESVNDKDIYLDVGYQRHYFSSGAGTVATSGSGDVVVNSLKSGNDRMYLTFNANNVAWGHSGDLRVTGQGGLKLLEGGALPSGAATGGIKLEGSTELYLDSKADSLVNAIEGPVRSIGWSWLKFGHSKDGVFKNTSNVGGVCHVEKHGTDTTLTLGNTAFYKLDVKNGTVVATGGATVIHDLAMAANTTLNVVDTTFAATNTATFNSSAAVSIGEAGVFDAVASEDAVFFLDSAGSVVKRGDCAWNVYPKSGISGRIHVSGGTMKFCYKEQRSCADDQWWRISITKQAYLQKGVTLAEIGLFAGNERINGGLSATTAEVSAMPNGTAKITSSDFSSGNVANLFDSNGSTIWGPNWQDPPSSAPDIYGGHPLTIVLRLPSSHIGKIVTAVDISDSAYFNDHAKSFTVESSPDGVNWTTRGSYNDLSRVVWANWYGGSSHFAVPETTRVIEGTGQGGVGLQPGTVVRVDAGATLDLSLVKASDREISALEIDASIGGGTITDAVFAREGTVNLLNASREALKTLKLPLSFVRADGAGNIRNWKVAIDGNVVPGWGFHVVDGAVVFTPPGTTIVIR